MDFAELHRKLGPFLEPDGSWRDIVVKDVTWKDWRAAVAAIAESGAPCRYLVGGEPAEFPPRSFPEVWLHCEDPLCPGLTYMPEGVCIITQFFDESEIEFDVDPKDVVRSPGNFADLLQFMRLLGIATGKRVLLTHENRHDWIGLTWNPFTRAFEVGPYAEVPS